MGEHLTTQEYDFITERRGMALKEAKEAYREFYPDVPFDDIVSYAYYHLVDGTHKADMNNSPQGRTVAYVKKTLYWSIKRDILTYSLGRMKKGKYSIITNNIMNYAESAEVCIWCPGHLATIEEVIDKHFLTELLGLLTPLERKNIVLHYIYGYTQTEIAKMQHVTLPAVNYSIRMALKKMREGIRNDA